MAELALGILGVVPMALKSYQVLASKLKTFRHCSSIVQRMYKMLRVQRRVFENECQLLLRDCLNDDSTAQIMVADPDHRDWGKRIWDDDLRASLNENYDDCVELVQSILETIRQLESDLDCFETVKTEQKKGERLKDTWKRVSNGLKMTFNKTEYETGLDDLRTTNSDLQNIREQIYQLQKPCNNSVTKRPATSLLEWVDIRRASKALHDALVGAWSCSQPSHTRHMVKLFLEAEKANEDVQMTIAILCQGHTTNAGQVDFIELQVKSRQMDWVPYSQPSMPLPDPDEAPSRKRIKTVRFSAQISKSCSTRTTTEGHHVVAQSLAFAFSDLRCSKDVCSELTIRCGRKPTGINPLCLGHIDDKAEENYRHQFFSPSKSFCQGIHSSTIELSNSIPMDTILCESSSDAFSTVDKLKMARALVSAVLKFHATPWLGEIWRLQDLSFLHQGGQDLTLALQTLHVGVEFGQKSVRRIGLDSNVEDVQMASSSSNLWEMNEDELLYCGIDNVALHCLGVALLQIDRLKKFEPGDVLGVRRVGRVGSTLGPRYQEITQKCLRCDFGYGTDLGKTQLQKAVYESVVGALESMISTLSIDDDL